MQGRVTRATRVKLQHMPGRPHPHISYVVYSRSY